MDKTAELISVRKELSELVIKANSMPLVIRQQGIDMKIDLLKEKEKELVDYMTIYELKGQEMDANKRAGESFLENMMKSKKTLAIAGGVSLLLLSSIVVGAVIYKKRHK